MLTIVVTLAELLVSSGSEVPEVTDATSVICVWFVVPAFTLTASVNVPAAALATSGFVQLTFPVAPTAGMAHDQPAGTLSDRKVVLVGIASVNTAFTAASGPLFVTTCV